MQANKTTILVADDEKEIRDMICIYLEHEGYNVITASDGDEAIELLNSAEVDLIILDVMMPNVDGISACKEIRESNDMPIIMLSAKGQDNDRIIGLMTGADDYVVKPFNLLELLIRVKRHLIRYDKHIAQIEDEIVIDDLSIISSRHEVKVSGAIIQLTSKEFDILKLLAENKGIVFSNRNIYESVWNETFYESDNTIMSHIKNIREKLGDSPKLQKYIKTVWGVGYKIEK